MICYYIPFLIKHPVLVIHLFIYIYMDANANNLSSPSLSQAYLSQRWFDTGSDFPQLKNESPSHVFR